jgi:DNA helicase-2/ATP-dependent DNA helicase PcrA
VGIDLSLLNPQQRAAVVQTEGPLLVLAGAGSGKTRVIAHRVVHLMDKGTPPRAILAVTFTNKAAAEMKERIVKLAAGGDVKAGAQRCRGLTVSTFHAFGVRVLRKEHLAMELPPKFAIFDSGDQASLVKRLMRDINVEDKRFDVPRLISSLSRRRSGAKAEQKPMPTSPDDGDALARGQDPEYELLVDELMPRYELGLRAMGAVDFDDLLLLPLKLFKSRPDILAQYQARYRYLLVDEYQDTNQTQLELLELLAGMRRNLCVVGDDDQSIYAWRGAQVENILNFDKRFPGCVEIFLEQNYRSTGNVLDAANAVIGKNTARKAKKLWTAGGRGSNIRLVVAPEDEAEARWIADEIVRLSFEEKIPRHETAVLYRTNAQAKPIEETLRLAGIPYRVIGGTSLFDRKEVRDLLSYLRAAMNPRDEVSLLRIVNVPARGIGDQTVAKAQELARKKKVPVYEILKRADQFPELEQAKERVLAFAKLIEKYGPRLSRAGFGEAARSLVEEVGLFDEAKRGAQSGPAQARRVEAVEGLLRQLSEYEKRQNTKAEERLAELAQLSALQRQDAAVRGDGAGGSDGLRASDLAALATTSVVSNPQVMPVTTPVVASPQLPEPDAIVISPAAIAAVQLAWDALEAPLPSHAPLATAAKKGSAPKVKAEPLPEPAFSLNTNDQFSLMDGGDIDEELAAGLSGYLRRLALDQKEASEDGGDAVTLMTLHGAKGLEWRAVILCGLEEGLLPHSGKGFDDGGDAPQADGVMNLDEERRLTYVGITRAREKLAITRCRERIKRGKPQPRTPSRFLEDIPVELLDVIDLAGPPVEGSKELQAVKAGNFFAAMNALLGAGEAKAK